jgi:hypothetical protein
VFNRGTEFTSQFWQ